MAVTRSTAADRKTAPPLIRQRNPRSFELASMLVASLIVLAALALTYMAKTTEVADAKPLFLSDLARAEQLIPYLQILPTPAGAPGRRSTGIRSGADSWRSPAECRRDRTSPHRRQAAVYAIPGCAA